jgi:hypothetical protein
MTIEPYGIPVGISARGDIGAFTSFNSKGDPLPFLINDLGQIAMHSGNLTQLGEPVYFPANANGDIAMTTRDYWESIEAHIRFQQGQAVNALLGGSAKLTALSRYEASPIPIPTPHQVAMSRTDKPNYTYSTLTIQEIVMADVMNKDDNGLRWSPIAKILTDPPTEQRELYRELGDIGDLIDQFFEYLEEEGLEVHRDYLKDELKRIRALIGGHAEELTDSPNIVGNGLRITDRRVSTKMEFERLSQL